MTKSVLVLNQFALPRDQGGGTRHADLFSRLERWRPVIVAGNRNHYTQQRFTTADESFRLVGVPAADGGARKRLLAWLAYILRAAITALREPDLRAVVASSPHLLAPVLGVGLARIRRIPFILEIRDLWPESLVAAGAVRSGSALHKLLALVERQLVQRADSIITVTSGWEKHFEDLGALDRVTVIPNGAELSDFAVSDSRESLRDRYGIRGFTAIFAGAHGPKDGLQYILEAAHECPDVNFLLVGDGPSKREIIAYTKAQGLLNIEFRPPVPKEQLPSLLAACDVGVHAVTPLSVFDHGMSPNKLFDYLASGLPVASNAKHALSSFIADDQCGRLGESTDLASCIRAVESADDRTRERWKHEAFRLMSSRFSRTASAEKLEAILESTSRG
jgi:glycosyltransferase involved in cell wall biosynthesis